MRVRPSRYRSLRAATVTLSAAALVVGASTPALASGGTPRTVTITVVDFSPAPPASALAKFTAQTGIKVKWTVVAWDPLQTKIAAAAEAHAYFADVTDVDWSEVGEYYNTKWFVPLNKYFNIPALNKQYPELSAFLYHGELVGMPGDDGVTITTVNKVDFSRAGITTMPRTLSQYTKDLETIKSKGVVKYPLDIPFAAAEGLATYWYQVSAAEAPGGQVLSPAPAYKPLFTSPSSAGYKALVWMISALKDGLVSPANINYTDAQGITEEVAHNRVASCFSEYAGDISSVYNLPADSTVVDDIEYIPIPGAGGPALNLEGPDGLGVPVNSPHPAAAVTFIKWYDQPTNQAAWSGADGASAAIEGVVGPANVKGMNLLAASSSGKAADVGEEAYLEQHKSRPTFNGGSPAWEAHFDNDVYTEIHDAAAGQATVAQVVKTLASDAVSLKASY